MKALFGNKSVELTGPIYDGICLRQEFEAEGFKLVSVAIYLATYKRSNPGTVVVEVHCRTKGVLARAETDAARLQDNSFREFGLGVNLHKGRVYELRLYTKHCRAGQSPTAAHGIQTKGGPFFSGARLLRGRELKCEFSYEGDAKQGGRSQLKYADHDGPDIPEESIRGLVSVIVPHYNCLEYLPKCLAALSRQTYKCMEVIVVDDGTGAKAAVKKVVDSFRSVLPALELVRHSTNRGAPAARNTGACKARGEYLFFCDADVDLYPEALQCLVEALLDDHGAAFAYGGFVWGAQRVPPKSFDTDKLREHNYVSTMSLLRSAMFPGWDETLKRHQDWDLWLTVLDNGGRGVCCGKFLFETPVREGGISSDDNLGMMKSRDIVKRKHRKDTQ